ncbi:cupin domain-containing protein [Aspergillus clavatus NRRL 1]|uniref:Cupin domain protein n=1 Tax=Aspergillus clavatus (strain ATCC 1007 / CBS 513.65 / DSM 816 / NCTC 3887 / NRRL 1 / QM 1276 / 107) TaxID=344612 RepID=A1CCK1_ASPCL|nr:cupin domain protein [Aspergillus clavatus NRRL 1]EAW12258.1 cupin domain protein [Aspergillus clavatus NRRL 1]
MSQKPNNLPSIKRFITTHSSDGESIFLSHAQIPDYIPSKPISDDGDIALLYTTVTNPVSIDDENDIAIYDEFLHTSPGLTTSLGTVLRTIDLRPGEMTPMHRTVSVDYAIVVEGEVEIILDSGESRSMRRGDVCVQRGTAHSCKNRSTTEWCRMMFVFLPMLKITIKGHDMSEEVYDEQYDEDSPGGEKPMGGKPEN